MIPIITGLLLTVTGAPLPKDKTTEIILVQSNGEILRLNAQGRIQSRQKLVDAAPMLAAVSPEGKRVAWAERDDSQAFRVNIFCEDLVTSRRLELPPAQHVSALFWGRDGRSLRLSGLDIAEGNKPQNFRHQCWQSWSIDLATAIRMDLELEGEYRILGYVPKQTEYFAARTFNLRPVAVGVLAPQVETHLVDVQTLKTRRVIAPDAEAIPIAMFPDGKRWLIRRMTGEDRLNRIGILDPDGTFNVLPRQEKKAFRVATLTPDGESVLTAGSGQLWQISISDFMAIKLLETDAEIISIDIQRR